MRVFTTLVLALALAVVPQQGASATAASRPLTSAETEQIAGQGCWGCALAVAGTVGTSVGAIWVTGGASLIYFMAMKTIATASLIDSCSSCSSASVMESEISANASEQDMSYTASEVDYITTDFGYTWDDDCGYQADAYWGTGSCDTRWSSGGGGTELQAVY